MKKVRWELEEAVALFDAYVKNGKRLGVPKNVLESLNRIYNRRAQVLGLDVDEKFRNIAGLNMQLAGIHYVVTNGEEGLANAGKIFYEVNDLYEHAQEQYEKVLEAFYEKYGCQYCFCRGDSVMDIRQM